MVSPPPSPSRRRPARNSNHDAAGGSQGEASAVEDVGHSHIAIGRILRRFIGASPQPVASSLNRQRVGATQPRDEDRRRCSTRWPQSGGRDNRRRRPCSFGQTSSDFHGRRTAQSRAARGTEGDCREWRGLASNPATAHSATGRDPAVADGRPLEQGDRSPAGHLALHRPESHLANSARPRGPDAKGGQCGALGPAHGVAGSLAKFARPKVFRTLTCGHAQSARQPRQR